MIKKLYGVMVIAGALCVSVCKASEADVTSSMNEFLTALHDLDLQRMHNCFADDLTVFQHSGDTLTRIDSKDELRKALEPTIAFIREAVSKQGRTSPPYHDVGARDMRVQMLSDDAAIVTFVMPNPTFVRRLSAVYARRDGNWKIVHMHTSTRNRPK
ncbi:MAG TPA: nuclear transport factor 2 family protein [Bryobacteraceae bacterium]|nr:nuclear transport factor 2 family protein [Bryobacteraceae bacterium]